MLRNLQCYVVLLDLSQYWEEMSSSGDSTCDMAVVLFGILEAIQKGFHKSIHFVVWYGPYC